jgi:hypothetical protein
VYCVSIGVIDSGGTLRLRSNALSIERRSESFRDCAKLLNAVRRNSNYYIIGSVHSYRRFVRARKYKVPSREWLELKVA